MSHDREEYLRAKFGLGPAPQPYQPINIELLFREIDRRSRRVAFIAAGAAATAGAVALMVAADGVLVALVTYLVGRIAGDVLIRRDAKRPNISAAPSMRADVGRPSAPTTSAQDDQR